MEGGFLSVAVGTSFAWNWFSFSSMVNRLQDESRSKNSSRYRFESDHVNNVMNGGIMNSISALGIGSLTQFVISKHFYIATCRTLRNSSINSKILVATSHTYSVGVPPYGAYQLLAQIALILSNITNFLEVLNHQVTGVVSLISEPAHLIMVEENVASLSRLGFHNITLAM
ncbi:hypothetical protein VNO77_23220 [Canavalia gladiata]|uniref:Uncharacterized protein n=1 Tax=Canavalia gladiata TaxID=3824 RepID=A0AAN9QBP4_CANGL